MSLADPAAESGSPRDRRGLDLAVLVVLVVAILGLAYWAGRGGERPLRQTAIGFDGLVAWLRADGLDASSFEGGALLERDRIGLRILPLYDGNLDHRRTAPRDREERVRQADQVDILRAVVNAKIHQLPTLVVLPKWRTGVALAGVAHPDLLREPGDNPVDRGQLLSGRGAAVVSGGEGFADFAVPAGPAAGLRARLYMPQVVRGSFCEPVIGRADAMLLGRCHTDGRAYWLLADPDLLNSHGLRQGDNAAIAKALLAGLADGKPIVVDYSTFVWAQDDRAGSSAPENRRSWADLGRFFAPPFGYLWAAFAVLAALVLWRASVRYGPALRRFDDGPGAAKAVSIAAKARLLRLTGHDDALLRVHVAGRLHAVAAELLGPTRRGPGEPLDQVCLLVGRRDPVLSRELQEAAAEAGGLPPSAPTAEAVRRLDRFETVIYRVLHDFGRSTRSR